MKVYISGAISGIENLEAINNFNKAEKKLNSMGFVAVYNPLKDLDYNDDGKIKYQKTYLKALLEGDTICMIPGWETSKEAKLEFSLATSLNYNIIHLDS